MSSPSLFAFGSAAATNRPSSQLFSFSAAAPVNNPSTAQPSTGQPTAKRNEGARGTSSSADGKPRTPAPNDPLLSKLEQIGVDSLSNDLEKQFGNQENSDVTFQVGDDVIPAHKWILRVRSTYFETLFASGMRESTTNQIEVKDADAESFKIMLKFLYCGKLPNHIKFGLFAPTVLVLAEKYDVKELKDTCEAVLKKSLTKENAIFRLVLAEVHGCPDLKNLCIKNLAQWKQSMAEDDFAPLEDHPNLLVKILTHKKRHRSGANSNDDNAVVNPPNINGVVVKIERDSPETDDSSYNSPRHNVVDPQCTTPPTKRTRLAVDAVPVAPSNACKSLQLYRGDNTKRTKSVNTNGGQTALAPIYAGMRAILKDHLGPAPLPLMAIPFNDSESDTQVNPPIKSESLPATNHPVPSPQQPWLKCYNCNGYGHMSWSCSLASICFTCKKGGHFARSCPQTICFKCGNFGHKSFNCRN